MKKLMVMITLLFGMILSANTGDMFANAQKSQLENEAMCKLFKAKAETYKIKMRDDKYATATLKSYQNRADYYCAK